MMNVFYYYYYLFYTKVLPDNQPHSTVIFTLSFTLSLIVNCIVNVALAYFLNVSLRKWEMIGIFAFITLLLYLAYYRNGKGKRIVKEKPKLFKSNVVSIVLTVLLFLIGILTLFLQADITKSILTK
jgi:hypothetical protein